MADLNQPTDIKNYFATIQARHVEIDHFIYGSVNKLEQKFGNTVLAKECVLHVEWPQKQYRDNGGSVSTRLYTTLYVLKNINKGDYDLQDETIEKTSEILNDIIMRMRRELFDNGHIFDINDLGEVDPVYHYKIHNCYGVRVSFPLGDWVPVARDASKWTDL